MSQAITFKTEMKEKNEAEDGVDVEDNSSKQPKLNDFKPWIGVRHLILFLIFLGNASGYAMRVNLSIAMVAMVKSNNSSPNDDFEQFDWDSSTKNTVLSSFFWGYVVTQIPSGLLAQTFGAKWLLLCGVTISSVATLLTPVVAHGLGWGGVCGLRVIEGLSQATLFPSMHSILSRWGPPAERGRMATIAFSGSQVGTVVALPIGGLLAGSGGGWPSIFYVFGGLGLGWSVLWFFLSASSPAEHSFVSEREREYIEASLQEKTTVRSVKTPWLSIVTSGPMWAVLLAHCAQNWGFWILMTEMPTYMNDVLGFDIKDNGLLSALPYLAMALLSYFFGWLSDLLVEKKLISLVWARKLFNTIGFWGPAVALVCLGYITKDQVTLGVVLLVLSVGLNAGVYVGFQVNHIDLSPNFAGTMMGITNGVSNIFSLVGPLVVGIVVTTEGSTDQWRIIFWISAVVYFTGNILFAVLGKAEKQPWDDIDYTDDKNKFVLFWKKDERKTDEA